MAIHIFKLRILFFISPPQYAGRAIYLRDYGVLHMAAPAEAIYVYLRRDIESAQY
jgi:hypothetical protein